MATRDSARGGATGSADAGTDRTFLGTGWSFPPSFEPRTHAAVMVSQEADIAQSLFILLSTAPGERVMHPTFGCGLKQMVFEHINESTVTEIRDIVRRAVLFFEPRITLASIDVDTTELMSGVLRLSLDYVVRTTNARSNMVFPLYMTEGNQAGQIRLSA
jgi:phage baseplate assembly protein W